MNRLVPTDRRFAAKEDELEAGAGCAGPCPFRLDQLVIEEESTGILAKLAGHVTSDPTAGQVTATFAENPELPVEDVKLSLSTLVPWSTPEGAVVHPTDSFQTTVGGS